MAVAAAPAEVGFSAAEVGLVFGFLFLLAAISILDAIRPPVVNLAGGVPLVGAGLASAVDAGLGVVRKWLYDSLQASLIAFSDLTTWLQTLWASAVQVVESFSAETAAAATRITTLTIPLAILQAEGLAAAELAGAEARAQAALLGAEAALGVRIGKSEALAAGLVTEAQAEAHGLFLSAEADAAALVAHAESAAAALIAGERAFTVGAVAGVEADLQAAFAKAASISAAAEAALRGDLGAVERQLAGDLASGVSALEQQIAKAQALLTAGLAGVAAATTVAALEQAFQCLKYCSQLASLGGILQDVEDLGLIAFAFEVAHDPKAAQSQIVGLLGPLAQETAQLARSTLGV